MRHANSSLVVALAGFYLLPAVAASVTITPVSEDRRVRVVATYNTTTNSDGRTATPSAPFLENVGTGASGAFGSSTADASQNSSMTSTSITGSGDGTASAEMSAEFDTDSGEGESICDVTFTISSDAHYHLTGSVLAQALHHCHSQVTLYSGTSTVILDFGAGLDGPGAPFDNQGELTAGTYRIRAQAVGLASATYGASDGGFAAFDFNLSLAEQAGVGVSTAPEVALLQNFPNPFHARTSIPFSLTEAGAVNLRIIDLQGRSVATLFDGEMTAGRHEIGWEANDAPAGIYFYRLERAGRTSTRKLVVTE